MTLLFAGKKAAPPCCQAAAGGSETEGLPPDVARGWVGGEIKIIKAVLVAMND